MLRRAVPALRALPALPTLRPSPAPRPLTALRPPTARGTLRPPGPAAARWMAAAPGVAMVLWLTPAPAVPAATPDGESIDFTATQSGSPLQGRFENFRAQLAWDPQHLQGGSVHVVVDTGSVETGAPQTNALLRSGGFFDAGQYAQARFDASEFADQGGGRYVARGTFVLKNHVRQMPVTFSAARGTQGLVVDGSFKISRLEFAVGEGEWADTGTVDDSVVVHFHLVEASTRP